MLHFPFHLLYHQNPFPSSHPSIWTSKHEPSLYHSFSLSDGVPIPTVSQLHRQHLHSIHLEIWGLVWTSQQQPRLLGLLGRLGISREGHGSLAGSPTTPAGCYTGAAGVVAEIQGDEGGGRESCEAEGGRGRGSGGLSHCEMHCWEAQMDQWAAVCCDAKCELPHTHPYINTHAKTKAHLSICTQKTTFIMQHLVLGALNLTAVHTVHTNKLKRNTHANTPNGACV